MSFFCSEINLSYCDILHGYIICSVYHKFSNICKPEEGWYLGKGGGGKGDAANVNAGRLRSKVQPLTLLYTIFSRKKVPLW